MAKASGGGTYCRKCKSEFCRRIPSHNQMEKLYYEYNIQMGTSLDSFYDLVEDLLK